MVGIKGYNGSAIPEAGQDKYLKKILKRKKGGAVPASFNWARKHKSALKKIPRAIPLKKGGRVKRGRKGKH